MTFNDDMMLVGPVQPTDFFSHDGKVKLRGRWSNWAQFDADPEENASIPYTMTAVAPARSNMANGLGQHQNKSETRTESTSAAWQCCCIARAP
jgi:hypothetical protein